MLTPLDNRVATIENKILSPASDTEPALPPLKRFFRRILTRLTDANKSSELTTVESPSQPKTPWLTWNDLFAAQTKTISKHKPETEIAIVPTPKLRTDLTTFVASTTDIATTENQEPERSLDLVTQTSSQPANLSTSAQQTQELTTHQQKVSATEMEARPEWIETEALNVGYEEHFLERILKKVDQVMAWVEETLSKILSRLRE